jgi:hypothetical protein
MRAIEPGTIERDKVFAALKEIIASDEFATSPQLTAFLTFSVNQTLDGQGPALKAYTIATEVLGRPSAFDPQNDPIVRVEATRLRRAIDRYYTTKGASDPLRITMPKGGYSVTFESHDAEPLPTHRPSPSPRRDREGGISIKLALVLVIAFFATASAVGIGWKIWSERQTNATLPQILTLQEYPEPPLTQSNASSAIPPRSVKWKPRIAAIAIQTDSTAKRFMNDIVDIMIRFDGITVFQQSITEEPIPDDLYTLEGTVRSESASTIDIRLIHAASGRIVLGSLITLRDDNEVMRSSARKLALEIAGRNGVIRTDALPAASTNAAAGSSPQACLAMVHVAIKTQEVQLLASARLCMDELLKSAGNSSMLLALSADLRRHEKSPNLDKVTDEAKLAIAMNAKNVTAMAVLSDVLETKNMGLALRIGDTAVEANPYDPELLRAQAKRLQAAGLISRAELLLSSAELLD